MKVVLLADVKALGKKGELVNVADGYGKNYLIPHKLAVIADNTALNELKNREQAKQYKIETEKAAAKASAEKIDGKTIKVSAKAGQNGKLFGSVTSKEIAEVLSSEFGFEADRKKITCSDIRSYGTYECSIKLYTGISASFYVLVGE